MIKPNLLYEQAQAKFQYCINIRITPKMLPTKKEPT